jgi:hypothetical protein
MRCGSQALCQLDRRETGAASDVENLRIRVKRQVSQQELAHHR